ncbi:Rieske [2Fe-2S] iron-sulfur domain [Trinorchestia longiramus]|nr:Rieske [2Fe-2S] iron-sulfur domain [Trinorchestia longiramus]
MPSSRINIAWQHATHSAMWSSVNIRDIHLEDTFCIFISSCRVVCTYPTEMSDLETMCSTVVRRSSYTTFSTRLTMMSDLLNVEDVGWSFVDSDKKSSVWSRIFGTLSGSSGRDLATKIRRLQKLRRAGNLPPVYPNGWFAIIESRNLKPGEVQQAQVLGETIAVFRGKSGAVWAVDAYCPHLGANMAAGGAVRDDCLECPFHGWQFRGCDGVCTVIPYAKKVPDVAKVRYWETHETNGFVFVWHDAEDQRPHWRVPELPEVASGQWRYRGRTEHHVLAHIQVPLLDWGENAHSATVTRHMEIPENGADIAHLGHLHVPSVFKGADLFSVFANNKLLDVAKHEWHGSWTALEGENAHTATVSIEHTFRLTPGSLKLFNMTVEAQQIGPGLVHLHLDTSLGRGVLVQTVTPTGPLSQKITHHLYSSSTFLAPFAKFVLHSEACHLERDIMIWNSKQYLQRPLLVAEDKLIKRFRKWYQQFYSPNSPTIESVESTCDLEW